MSQNEFERRLRNRPQDIRQQKADEAAAAEAQQLIFQQHMKSDMERRQQIVAITTQQFNDFLYYIGVPVKLEAISRQVGSRWIASGEDKLNPENSAIRMSRVYRMLYMQRTGGVWEKRREKTGEKKWQEGRYHGEWGTGYEDAHWDYGSIELSSISSPKTLTDELNFTISTQSHVDVQRDLVGTPTHPFPSLYEVSFSFKNTYWDLVSGVVETLGREGVFSKYKEKIVRTPSRAYEHRAGRFNTLTVRANTINVMDQVDVFLTSMYDSYLRARGIIE